MENPMDFLQNSHGLLVKNHRLQGEGLEGPALGSERAAGAQSGALLEEEVGHQAPRCHGSMGWWLNQLNPGFPNKTSMERPFLSRKSMEKW